MLIPPPSMLLNWLLDVHITGYQSYVDPPCYSTGYWMYMSRDISHMLIPPPPCYSTGYWMNNHVTGYQSYVDPPCYPTGYCMNISWDISHMLISHVTQLVIGCTCHGIPVIMLIPPPSMLLNWLLDVHITGYQPYVDPPSPMLPNWLLDVHVTGYQSYVDPPPPMLLNWLLDVHVTGYQSYVDPSSLHVTQLVIGCTCHGIPVIC